MDLKDIFNNGYEIDAMMIHPIDGDIEEPAAIPQPLYASFHTSTKGKPMMNVRV
jgi:hypothetical protein